MAPASLEGLPMKLCRAEEDQEWCKWCLERSEKNTMQLLQINEDLAVLVCNNEKCTPLPVLAPGSELVVPRRAADIIHSRRRKRRAAGLPSASNLNPAPLPVCDVPSHNSRVSQTMPRAHSLNSLQSPLPTTSVVQWSSEDQLCWLDVSMLLLVQSPSLRQCHQIIGGRTPLNELCKDFDRAQEFLTSPSPVTSLSENCSSRILSADNRQRCVNRQKELKKNVDSKMSLLSSYFREESRECGKNNPSGEELCPGVSPSPTYVIDMVMANAFMGSSDFRLTSNATKDSACLTSNTLLKTATSHCADRVKSSSQDRPMNLAAAVDLLRGKRRELLAALKQRMQCEVGQDGSPVTTLPILLRLDGATEEHLSVRYRRECYCFSCGFTNVTVHRNVVLSVTSVSNDFSMQHPKMHHPCPECRAPGQITRVTYHSLPTCLLVHLTSGLSNNDDRAWTQHNFDHHGRRYQLRCVVQYKRMPDHFVIWIRDPTRELWLKCDDLCSPVCHWQSQEPCIPPSEVHILSWERQGGNCDGCLSLQQQVTEILEAPPHMDGILTNNGIAPPTHQGTDKCLAPLQKKICPVIIGRNASPSWDTHKAASSIYRACEVSQTTNFKNCAITQNGVAPHGSIHSLATPPHSPELQMPKYKASSTTSHAASTPDGFSSQPVLSRNNSNIAGLQSSASLPGSVAVKATGRSVRAKIPWTRTVFKRDGSSFDSGLLKSIPSQLIQKVPIENRRLSSPAVRDTRRVSQQSFSLLRTLRALNVNATLRVEKDERERIVIPKTQKAQPDNSPSPRKVQKVRLPHYTFDSFSAFKQKNSSKFSGYLKQVESSLIEVDKAKYVESAARSKRIGTKNHTDQYQPSGLLTPSSSVSSPSTCSESSLQNENMVSTDGQNSPVNGTSSKQNLSSTMDALYKSLNIHPVNGQGGNISHSAPYLEDDSFLEGLLQ